MDLATNNAKRIWAEGQGVYDDLKLAPVVFEDKYYGVGTDAKLLFGFGFGGSLDSSIVLEPEPNVQHTLRHYIAGGVEGGSRQPALPHCVPQSLT